jgi:hypothetical protein
MPLPLLIPAISAGLPLLGKLLSGGAKGAAAERGGQNDFTLARNSQALSQYGTQQNALIQSLLAKGQEATNRYNTNQGATTAATSGLQNATSRALEAQSGEGMQRAQLGLQAPSVRARQSVLGSLMKNLQPVKIQGPAGQAGHTSSITGGLSASALDPTTRQHGDELMKAALMAQMTGSDIPKATDFQSGIQDWKGSVLDVPEATDYSKGIIAPPELGGYKDAGKGESLLAGGGMLASILGELLKLRQQGGSPEEPSAGAG